MTAPVENRSAFGVRRLKYLADVRPSNVDKKSVDGEQPVWLCNYTDVYYNESIDGTTDFMSATATQAQVERFELQRGDVLLTKDSESPDDIGIPSHVTNDLPSVLCGYHLALLRPRSGVDGGFLAWSLRSKPVMAQLEVRASGVTRFGLSTEALSDLDLPAPPLDSQTAIADFLNRETERIDALVAKKQRLIELLQEKRIALISHAVTKGLDPDVPMQDSGIAWIGSIPTSWELRRLKHLSRFVTSGSRGWAEYYSDEGPLFIRITNLTRTSVDLDLSQIQRVSPPVGAEGDRTRVEAGDVLISITADIGTVNVVSLGLGEAYVNQHTALVRTMAHKVNPRWLALCLRSSVGQRQFRLLLQGGTKLGLNLDDVRNLIVVCPPLEQQEVLVRFLETQNRRLTALAESLETAIDRLREFRSALVTAAVTGQIDVRTYRRDPEEAREAS